jgi:hypothetical protein
VALAAVLAGVVAVAVIIGNQGPGVTVVRGVIGSDLDLDWRQAV